MTKSVTPLRAAGSPHGDLIRVKVGMQADVFARVSRLAYVHNVSVSALVRQMINRQLETMADDTPFSEAAE